MKKRWQLTETELLAGDLTQDRCDRCGGSGIDRQAVLSFDGNDLVEAERECACDCRSLPAHLMARANLPPRFAGLTLADLNWDAIEPPEVVRTVQDYAQQLETWLTTGMGLTAYGNVGSGKTHVAVGLVKLACGLGIESSFSTASQLLARLKATYDGGSQQEGEVLHQLATVPLLALDDLGTEHPTAWARARLYTLVNERYLAQRPTLVTTNYGPETLAERLGERTISRLWGTSLRVRFQGSDYRERVRRQKIRQVRDRLPHLRVLTR